MPPQTEGLQASIHARSAPPAANMTRAYYRIIRLDEDEIERRNSVGHCTYCNELGHSRRSCAAGRIMRKVPRRVLDSRLRNNVCPLCGDPDDDAHSKLTCPRKQELQAILSSGDKSSLRGRKMDGHHDGIPRHNSRKMKRLVYSKPLPKLGRGRAGSLSQPADVDLIDFGDTASDTTDDAATTAPVRTMNNVRSGRRTSQNLLDTEVTEVVWGGIVVLPLTKFGRDFDEVSSEDQD